MTFIKLIWWVLNAGLTQCWYNPAHWESQVIALESDNRPESEKLVQLQEMERHFNSYAFPQDSVYAHILHRMGSYYANDADYVEAIRFSRRAIAVNQSGRANCSASFTARSYLNTGLDYLNLGNYNLALLYLDTAINVSKKFFQTQAERFYDASRQACELNWREGNYEEALQIAEKALQHSKASFPDFETKIQILYKLAALSAEELQQYAKAKKYVSALLTNYPPQSGSSTWYSCKMIQVYIALADKNWQCAQQILQQTIDTAKYKNKLDEVQIVLNNQALYFLRSENPEKAQQLYLQLEALQQKTKLETISFPNIYNSLGNTCSLQQNHAAALNWFVKAFNIQAGTFAPAHILEYPTCAQLASRPGKQMTFTCLRNKAEALMQRYRQTGDTTYLSASAKGFLLADSLFTNMRQNQTGEESKIYWRKNARNFYQQALEMCSEKNDSALAYQYMEKSRAVMLLDHLNELNAVAKLSPQDSRTEDELNLDVLNKKLQLRKFSENSLEYSTAQKQLNDADEKKRDFVQSLEKKYPDYYRYKYASSVTPVDSLQKYLAKNRQQWVQYFLSDSLLFVLYANGKSLKLYRKVVKSMEQEVLPQFVRQCADKESQRRNFSAFLQTSAQIYDTLLGNLHLQPGRLIISPDNTVIPFDALCTNLHTRRWMVQDFAISYAYSAGFLLKKNPFTASKPAGTFLGMAPVHFPPAMKLAPLVESQQAISHLKPYFSNALLVTNDSATSETFLKQLPHYTIVTVYTHARSINSDTTEPELFFADRPVPLTELNRLQNPATQLVMLSACQTNTGREAIGEGVFSLARGFAMAGVPATVATLWQADEIATYKTTELFCERLTQGQPKDVALQKARLQMMGEDGMSLPFYWANMTLTGSADSLNLQPVSKHKEWYWLTYGIIAALVAACSYWRIKRKHESDRTIQSQDPVL